MKQNLQLLIASVFNMIELVLLGLAHWMLNRNICTNMFICIKLRAKMIIGCCILYPKRKRGFKAHSGA